MARLAWAAAIAACTLAACLANAAPAQAAPAEAPVALDLAALGKQVKTVDIADDDLRAALVTGKPAPDNVSFAPAIDLGAGNAAVAWAECTQAACRGQLAIVSGAPVAPKLVKRVALVAPAKVFFVDGFTFTDAALTDLDGDGAPELVLHYSATEPPRAALGSLVHEYVAVYAPKDLSLLFSHELRRAGADSEDACQWTLARSAGALVASGQCNVRSCLEASTPDKACKPNRVLAETWRRSGQRAYARAAR